MPLRSRLFSLSALTKAYERNLRAFARVSRAAGAAVAPRRAAASRPKRARQSTVPGVQGARAARGHWHAGVAPGPAGARRYHLYVPSGLALAPGEGVPLLVMLHGCDQTAQGFAALTRMNQLAVRERFMVLYPEQERLANAHGCWNWFEGRSGKAEAEAATLLAAVEQVLRSRPVDPQRVAVAGLSAGASMAALMAARFPTRWCAVAMHSGVAPGTADSAATAFAAMDGRREAHLPVAALPAAALLAGSDAGASAAEPSADAGPTAAPLPPLLVIHGDADTVVSARNAAATVLLWAQALGARAGRLRHVQRGKRRAMQATDFRTGGRTQVALREVVGLGHAWSGGANDLPYSDPSGPDASALVWAFVAKQFAVQRENSLKSL